MTHQVETQVPDQPQALGAAPMHMYTPGGTKGALPSEMMVMMMMMMGHKWRNKSGTLCELVCQALTCPQFVECMLRMGLTPIRVQQVLPTG